jgi:sporulation protein YlmC with PRC-barrel domain
MSVSKVLTIGTPVTCSDGRCGELHQVVVDPVAGTVTHLVVEPPHQRGAGRLVPVGLISRAVPEVRLDCTMAQFGVLEPAEDTQFLPGSPASWGLGSEQVLSWPYYGLAVGGASVAGGSVPTLGSSLASYRGLDLQGAGAGPELLIEDRIPVGDIEVRRGDRVHAIDGDIGKVQGLIVDITDHRVSHVLLEEGHLWGDKTVAIPFSEVRSVNDGVAVELTKEQVRDLPPVDAYQFT